MIALMIISVCFGIYLFYFGVGIYVSTSTLKILDASHQEQQEDFQNVFK